VCVQWLEVETSQESRGYCRAFPDERTVQEEKKKSLIPDLSSLSKKERRISLNLLSERIGNVRERKRIEYVNQK